MRYILLFILTLSALNIQAQTYTLSGKVTDNDLLEPLIGVTVYVGEKGVVTDFNGDYRLELPNGTHEVKFSYVGFEDRVETVVISGASVTKDIIMGESSEVLTEVVVTADIAIERRTPVAFSNIPTVKIQEELAARDIPMLLNSTPGVYATETGGGDGDARVTIRGFNQRNVAVMLDGIPVNDMENGWVYWSNWFGLNAVTRSMQVQRGLGASKLAVPSVGGTMNILTKGIDAKRGVNFKQTIGNDGFSNSELGFTTGRLKNGLGISAAVSYKTGRGWVDQNWTNGAFYFLRIDKTLGKHTLTLSGFGAPQSHGQRSFRSPAAVYDRDHAENELDIPSEINDASLELSGLDRGLKYNRHWGEFYRSDIIDGDTLLGSKETLNTRKNYYHKPQFTIKDFWAPNNNFYLSNILYLSVGNGGGTGMDGDNERYLENGQIDLQDVWNKNRFGFYDPVFQQIVRPIDPTFSETENKATTILRSSINNHFWYGLLSTFNYSPDANFTYSGGIDMRSYKGEHYREVYDLLGGDYFTDGGEMLREGDKYDYHNDGQVRWGGMFGLVEYKRGLVSSFINLSGNMSAYQRIDYNQPEGEQKTDWKYIPGYTAKMGANVNVDEYQNVFMNVGYLSKTPRFNNVFNNDNKEFLDIRNEEVAAVELGYGLKLQKIAANVNAYATRWNNKPLDRAPSVASVVDPEDRLPVNINGIKANHLGLEIDFAYKPISALEIEGLLSVGDWKWQSGDSVFVYNQNGDLEQSIYFDAKGIHVGDAAQLQYGGSLRLKPVRDTYIQLKGIYFGKQYANLDPFSLQDENAGTESWKMPDYFLLDLSAGYYFKVREARCSLRGNILNILNATYISDANNNDQFAQPSYSDFDAKSATVFYGQGRRWTISLGIKL